MRGIAAGTLATLLVHWPAAADPTRALVATRVSVAPVLDGRLDDAVWARAVASDAFVQAFPREGEPPGQRTDVRVLYDDTALYVGLRMYDREPARIVSRVGGRDRDAESDWIYIGIDSEQGGTTGYGFRVNAAGTQYDELLYDDVARSVEWDAVWRSAVHRDDQGWSCEMVIPLSSLRFSHEEEQTWGFQVIRYIARTRETIHWRLMPSGGRGYVSRFGTLTGLRELAPERTLELRPYVLLSLSNTRGGDPRALGGKVGLDAKLGVTSALTLDVAIHPDFGQVEADEVVLNLSRFETFFPEKRPFFLERGDLFETPIQAFYSRRIGQALADVSEGGTVEEGGAALMLRSAPTQPVIHGASKLTGRLSERLSMGALWAVTGRETARAVDDTGASRTVTLEPVRSLAALRGVYSFGSASKLGFVATGVTRLGGASLAASSNFDQYAQGVDGQWQSRNGHWRVTAQGMLSERVGGTAYRDAQGAPCAAATDGCVPITRSNGTTLGPGDVGAAGQLSISMHTAHWLSGLDYELSSPRFDINALGFHQKFDRQGVNVLGGYQHLEPRSIFQDYLFAGGARAYTAFDGTPLLVEGWLQAAGTLNEKALRGFETSLAVFGRPSGTWDIHETLDGARFEQPWQVGAELLVETDPARMLSMNAIAVATQARAGDRELTLTAKGVLRAGERVQVDVATTLGLHPNALRFVRCVDDRGGDCDPRSQVRTYQFARLDADFLSLTTRGSLSLTPRLSINGYAQLFLARGRYHDYRELATAQVRPRIAHADLVATGYTGDTDGDGVKDDDFQDVSLNLNAVLRWELRPGTVLHAVYTRAQRGAAVLAGGMPRLRLDGLDRGSREDVFLLKLVYFMA